MASTPSPTPNRKNEPNSVDTVISSTSPLSKRPPQKRKRSRVMHWLLASSWFVMAAVVAAAAAVLWMAMPDEPPQDVTERTPTQVQQEAPATIRQVKSVAPLHELDKEVHPVSFDALVRDLRDYPPEFVDSGYLKKNQGKWTVQIMDVAEHDVVTDYLNLRKDREKFAYFRYRDETNQVRYVVTYDVMATPQLAMGAAKTIDFGLPANVRVIPEEIDRYIDVIENYELSQPVQDLAKTRPRRVRLQPTAQELAARRRATSQSSSANNNQESTRADSAEDKATNIRDSSDSNETLSVTEQRQLVVVDNDTAEDKTNTAGNNNAASTVDEPTPPAANRNQQTNAGNAGNRNNNASATERPVTTTPTVTTPIATKPTPVEPTPPRVTPSNQSGSQNNTGSNNNADSIGQLIEERTP